MLGFLLTMLAGVAGGIIFYKLKLPGGLMIGAMLSVVAFNAITAQAYMPYSAKFFAQVVAGAFIGSNVQKRDVLQFPRLVGPLAVMLTGLLITNIVSGLLINAVSPLSLVTALFSAIPGGMSDIPIIAADLGADPAKVVTLQFFRMAFGIGVFPSLIFAFDKRLMKKTERTEGSATPAIETTQQAAQNERPDDNDKSYKAIFVTILSAAAGGYIGFLIGIPAGTLILAMVAVLGVKMLTGKGFLPRPVRQVAQVFSGCYVGYSIAPGDLIDIKFLILPALVLLVCYMVNCFVTGHAMKKLFGFERKMAMLAATPAGASDMALISADIGVTSADLVVLQVLRLIFVISFFPQADMLLVRLFGG